LSAQDRQIIQIEDTPAYRRNQHWLEVESESTKMQNVLTRVIGDHRIYSMIFDQKYTTERVSDYLSQIDLIVTGNIDLVKIRWHESFQLQQDPLAHRYLIYIVLAGSLSQQIDLHQTFCCTPDTATIINPCQKLETSFNKQGEVLLISIDRDSIDSVAGKLLCRSLKQPTSFDTTINLTSELGLSLKQFVQFLWEAAANNHQSDFSPLVLQKLEQAFLACLIEGLPNSYSEELLYQTNGALACHLRKAQVFIESHLDEDIKLGDIAAATGVCPRLLQKAFSAHCGCSPMRFVTQARLHQIRRELSQATTNTKIVDVMMHYHLTQGGKFAKEYQQLFGEKPSDTLKRSSQIPQQNAPLWYQIDDVAADRLAGGVINIPSKDRLGIAAKSVSFDLLSGLQQLCLPVLRSQMT
jgi:AraC-like DNA-binding protein